METKNMPESLSLFEEESKDNLNSTFFNSEKSSLNRAEILDISLEIEKKDTKIYNDEKVYGVDIKKMKPFKLGKTFAMLYYKNTPLIVIGPDYLLALCLLSFVNIVYILQSWFIYPSLPLPFYYLGTSVYLTQVISHSLTVLINPGVPSRNHHITNYAKVKALDLKSTRQSGYKICKECNIIVHERKNVAHCHDCEICIEDHDHHCAWSSKCIGRVNLYPFYVFVFSTLLFIMLMFLSVMVMLVVKADKEYQDNRKLSAFLA